MVCSFGDQNDVAVFRELGLTPFQAINLEGCMTELAAQWSGMTVIDARNSIIEYLSANNMVAKIEER